MKSKRTTLEPNRSQGRAMSNIRTVLVLGHALTHISSREELTRAYLSNAMSKEVLFRSVEASSAAKSAVCAVKIIDKAALVGKR